VQFSILKMHTLNISENITIPFHLHRCRAHLRFKKARFHRYDWIFFYHIDRN